MENNSNNVYATTIPEKKKKLFSKAFCLFLVLPTVLLGLTQSLINMSVLGELLYAFPLCASCVPVIMWAYKRDAFIKECKRNFCEEKNIPADKVKNMRYDKATGQIIFTVSS